MGGAALTGSPNGQGRPRIAVLGLGEAGSALAAGLAAAAEVHGFDPLARPALPGVAIEATAAEAVAGAQVVLAVTAARDAEQALRSAAPALPAGALYADLATSSPRHKRELAGLATDHGARFVDVALLSAVSALGVRTPALASGAASGELAALLNPLGMDVVAMGGEPGQAAAQKLLRSVLMKGMAALLLEALRAAEAAGVERWLWRNLVEQLTSADEALAVRLLEGTARHAERRVHEMDAVVELLEELGQRPAMSLATREVLASVARLGVPSTPG
jgi:3-hydroxyisobutyrate dehydrogenase-like beta-hydroxyacid dehydrogenase